MNRYLYILVCCIGFFQIIGYISSNKAIRGIGIAITASPLPLVFTDVKGVETFANNFEIEYKDSLGVIQKVPITPNLYAKLKGPYNRRNIYGAAISYGPILQKDILNAVLDYGFCKKVMLNEMNFPKNATDFKIKIYTKSKGRHQCWTLENNCNY